VTFSPPAQDSATKATVTLPEIPDTAITLFADIMHTVLTASG
jgi:hypothetical protein